MKSHFDRLNGTETRNADVRKNFCSTSSNETVSSRRIQIEVLYSVFNRNTYRHENAALFFIIFLKTTKLNTFTGIRFHFKCTIG